MQELAHKVESILDRMRNKEIVPSPEVINILLLAFDQLKSLVDDYANSNAADISEISVALTGMLSSFLDPERKTELTEQVEIQNRAGDWRIEVSKYDLSEALHQGHYVYLVELDLIRDIEARGKRPWDLVGELNASGNIMACEINLAAVGTLDDETPGALHLQLLYATILDPDFVGGLFDGVDPEAIQLLLDPNATEPHVGKTRFQKSEPMPKTEPVREEPKPKAQPQQPSADSAQQAESSRELTPVPRETAQPPSVAPAQPPAAKAPKSVKMQRVAKGDAAESPEATASKVEDTLRVNVALLETLMNLAGEMVLGRNQLDEAIRQKDLQLITRTGQRLNLITTELQEAIMQTRMQPIGNVLTKFTRVVRDLSRNAGKQIHVEIKGKEVELDKAILEGINDPLTHMIRNAVDHGIEAPTERVAAGKPETGNLFLHAYHAAGQVVIEVADDGRGMDPERIAQAAVRKGQITAEMVAGMSDRDKLALIFLPGLSTAEKITDISGRGVGMDVVKTNIDRLGGKIDIESELGEGSMLRIYLPLTLAIMPSLLVSCGGERFAVAQANVQELIRIPAAEVDERLDRVGDQRNLLVRDRLIPVVNLDAVVEIPEEKRLTERSHMNVVVMQTGKMDYGLVVDDLHDTQEIVVRPLGSHFQSCMEYAGATILGSGHVAMILDVGGIAEKAKLSRVSEADQAAAQASEEDDDEWGDRMQLMILQNGENEPMAVPLDCIERLEEISREQIEKVGGLRAMQYRKRQLPLVMLSDVADVAPVQESENYVVLVIQVQDKTFGLLGAFPVDVFNGKVVVDETHRQPGVSGACIINDKTTLLLSVAELHRPRQPRALPGPSGEGIAAGAAMELDADGADETAHGAAATGAPRATILLAEDSGFFRSHLCEFLTSEGFLVHAGEDGAAAFELLSQVGESVQLVLTDIEMPRMDGLELTRQIRKSPRWQHLPIIAITTLAEDADIERGMGAGVTEYQVKLDKEKLLKAIERILGL